MMKAVLFSSAYFKNNFIEMIKAYKFRLYPNKHQAEFIDHNIMCCRYIYNWALNKKIYHYKSKGTALSRFDIQKELPLLKKENDTNWLNFAIAQSLQVELLNLDKAFQSFFSNKKGYPRFKSGSTPKSSFSIPQGTRLEPENSRVILPKIGGIKCRFTREIIGKVKTVTISCTHTSQYFISVLADDEKPLPLLRKVDHHSIGIHASKDFMITCSNGMQFPFLLNNKDAIEHIKILNKKLFKKKKGSREYKKNRLQLLREYEKVRNQRSDYIHKITHLLTDNETTAIFINDYSQIKNPINEKKCINSVGENLGHLYKLLEYKCKWKGINFIKISTIDTIRNFSNEFVTADAIKSIGLAKYAGGVSAVEPAKIPDETGAL